MSIGLTATLGSLGLSAPVLAQIGTVMGAGGLLGLAIGTLSHLVQTLTFARLLLLSCSLLPMWFLDLGNNLPIGDS